MRCIENRTELGKITKFSLIEKIQSLYSNAKLETKRKVDQTDIVRLLENLNEIDSENKVDFFYSRPILSGNKIDFTSAGQNQNAREMIDYVEKNFYQSDGIYRIFLDRKKEKVFHKIQLTRTNDNSMGSLYIEFYNKNLNKENLMY